VSRPPAGKPERRTAERRVPPEVVRAHVLLELDSNVLTPSAKGMGVGLGFSPPIGSRHTFVLQFGTRLVHLQGVVRNVAPDPGLPGYVVGIEFVEMEPEDARFIDGFVTRRLAEIAPPS
jgi:hypothetical protein